MWRRERGDLTALLLAEGHVRLDTDRAPAVAALAVHAPDVLEVRARFTAAVC